MRMVYGVGNMVPINILPFDINALHSKIFHNASGNFEKILKKFSESKHPLT